MLHLNIRSVNKHFDELCNLLDSTPLKFNLIACSETWITPQVDPNQFQITGYNIITENRISSMGGGVALFLKEDVDYCLGEDLRIYGIENIWEDAQNLIKGVIYNTANRSQTQFLDEFEQVLHTIYLSKRKGLILGDFNINTLSKSIIPKEYINLIQSEGFNPLVFEAMRITRTKISCLDHIHSNSVNSSTSGSIAADIADHLPVLSHVYDPKCSPIPDTIEVRDFKKIDKISFQNTLRNANWLLGYNSSDANESLSRFLHIFKRINNGHAPLKIIKIKKQVK